MEALSYAMATHESPELTTMRECTETLVNNIHLDVDRVNEDSPYSKKDSFGQRQPPLSVTINKILERYPDGQIFKEMIQNADDAGAKTVWFYVDERQHGTSNLPHPDLARSQGPALVAANDACFTEEDWEGIQSLQQSIKAKDPFKVGKFGIGFTSVYHLTDLPIIVSGNRLACFEPQEKTWRGEAGQAFELSDLISQCSDFVAPLNGLADFDSHSVRHGGYSQTIFRLPLRTEASGLSDNTYDIKKLVELLDALREEAKYLLLFLKSVSKIEVLQISPDGQHSTSFCIEIAPSDITKISLKRELFIKDLKLAHKKDPYQISEVIKFTVKFSVVITDNSSRNNQAGSSNWLIANYVESTDTSVLAAAAKQHTFPWVGAALELGGNSAGGRIFCFLPMPVEASSGLPIHINGTFGLNDNRRALKWPGIERKNDPTANWNKILVNKVLPFCYAKLLTKAKKHLSLESFYGAWPKVDVVKKTQFSEILHPLFTALFRKAVVWTEKTAASQLAGNWILVSQATFIRKESSLYSKSIIKKVLSSCGVQLVAISNEIRQALQFAKVTEVSQMLVRSKLRSHPESYSSLDQNDKRVILSYCLSDTNYCSDLSGLNLLPLANGTFTTFDSHLGEQTVYLCSDDCPCSLLPNLDHLLVDLSDDPPLQNALKQVADACQTKLRVITEIEVAALLSQAMPSDWRSSSLVSMPHSQLPSTWLQAFWKWLKNKNLKLFKDQLLVPCYSSSSHSTRGFCLTRLNSAQPVVYVSSSTSCPSSLLSALYKMNVMVCLQSDFSFVQHKQFSSYIKQFNANSVLDTIYSQSNYKGIVFTIDEAESLRRFFLSDTYSSTSSRKSVLQNLTIFITASNSQGELHSIKSAASHSVTKQALGEPSNCAISVSALPPNLILFSREDYFQKQLLQKLKLSFPADYELLVKHIFPLIRDGTLDDYCMNKLMPEVLDIFQILTTRVGNTTLSKHLETLPFVKTVNVHKTPAELFDPLSAKIAALYSGEDVFPVYPYNTQQRIQVLKSCGLRDTATPQQVLDIIYSISSPASSNPQEATSTYFIRAKVVLEYMSTSFNKQISGYYTVGNNRYRSFCFSDALKELATSRCWLPVLSDRPSDYYEELPWKGSGYNSHFISLSSSVVILSSSTASTLPHLVGSQMYLVSPTVSPQIAAMLSTDSASIAQHVIAHFEEILTRRDQLSAKMINSLVCRVYKYINSEENSCSKRLYSIKKWIYIKKKNEFVAPTAVALNRNPTFTGDLESYIYILPESLSQYTALFGPKSGIMQTVSQSQILSVLKMIRDDVQAGIYRTTSRETWRTVMNILNWLIDDGTKSVSEEIDAVDILVPIETESEWPQLVQASEVVYTDSEFLKEYWQSSKENDVHMFAHPDISTQLSKLLGVVPLSEYLNISEDTFEDTGQHEPLTTRLKNILEEYKDGLTIIKELLQNADDAEATEVNICYDTRQHETDPKKLFFSGMAEAHGPALIVHNNSPFSDEDFKNITKLAGGTKRGKVLKIGKFGTGFCSVYHMTDIPSFISKDRLYIFDPTLSYLKKEVKNPAQPGKKTKFTNKFISGSKQLDPYSGLFGFDRKKSYKGTMFRLPLRTHVSKLSETCYTEAKVKKLISAIRESRTDLLLFLQHVRTITIHQIDPGQTAPVVLFKISREPVPLPTSLPSDIEIRNLSLNCTDSELQTDSKSCRWLVSQNSVTDSQQQYQTASVACPLGASKYEVDTNFEGEIFCFLPLSQKTGLPVHVSSNFAVINNRRGIWTSDEATSQTDKEVEWNITLMNGVIAKAYHALLIALKEMSKHEHISNYIFHQLWPKQEKLLRHNPWACMIKSLYRLISSDQLFFSNYRMKWLYLNESKFLTPGILCQASEQSLTPACVLDVLKYLNIPIVDLPIVFHIYFNLHEVTINESAFTKLYFENLKNLELILSTRSEVIQCMLEVYAAEYDDETDRSYVLDKYFKQYACIPCTPDGKILKKCTDLIDPIAEFAPLFDSSESCFPIEQLSVRRRLSCKALRDLGIISETLPIDMLVERTKTIPELYENDQIKKALERAKLILDTLKKTKSIALRKSELPFIPFLPVLPKPSGYLFKWKGDNSKLMCGKDLMIAGRYRYHKDSDSFLVGSQVAFVNDKDTKNGGCGFISEKNLSLLKIRKNPSVDEVIAHLREVQETFLSQTQSKEHVSFTNEVCCHGYKFLDSKFKPEPQPTSPDHESLPPVYTDIKAEYGISHVWTGKQFVETEQVAKEWNIDGPYLYPWPACISSCDNLIKSLRLKINFTFEDVHRALEEMHKKFGEKPVDEHCRSILVDLIALIQKCEVTTIQTQNLAIVLPDEDYILRPSNSLEYIDVHWAPKNLSSKYVNEIVPSKLAKQLGVRAVISKMLDQYSTSIPYPNVNFGQHESLTTRIRTILHDYPLDITILKELLQNAEDAKATKMYVILDCRTHGGKGVLSANWSKLQGPALLVWNDSVFSEKDLEGIQRLGLGSKRNDSETIGHYGIGFNAVYHLTDCPSFITGGKTMCILDPHCEYIYEANERYPGRRIDVSSSKFWGDFHGIGSAFLRDGLDNCPPDLHEGTLFRFPLRYTLEHLKSSDIVKKDKDGNPEGSPINVTLMANYLNEWAPKIKKAMLFLTNVNELHFMTVSETSHTLETLYKFHTALDDTAQQSIMEFRKALSSFKNESGNQSCIIRYPLTIIDTSLGKEECKEEKWLIQQGVGDIEDEQQEWAFVDTLKPRHGIAALLHSSSRESISGELFCFLPLCIPSNLPVHINGNFFLHANRKSLCDSDRRGSKSSWNDRIFQALASSYANFLDHAREYYVPQSLHNTLSDVKKAIKHYYRIFPRDKKLDVCYQCLVINVYSKIVEHNCSVLAVIDFDEVSNRNDLASNEADSKDIQVIWCPPKSDNPLTQVYFAEFSEEWKDLRSIIEDIGMKLTIAGTFLQQHLNVAITKKEDKILSTNPETIFDFYVCSSASSQFPCSIENTVFKEVTNFIKFTKYLLAGRVVKTELSEQTTLSFPKNPFDHPLLLTADKTLRKFREDANCKVIKSCFSHLFPKAYKHFLHPDLVDIGYPNSYFLSCSLGLSLQPGYEYSLKLVLKIFSKQLPDSLGVSKLEQLPEDFSRGDLISLWKCLFTDQIFSQHQSELLKDWALLPATSGALYSCGDHLVPVTPLETDEETDEIFCQMYKLLQEIDMPIIDTDILNHDISSLPCPNIRHRASVLKALYHLSMEKRPAWKLNEESVKTVVTYLQTISFRFELNNQKYVRALPLFKCVDNELRALHNTKAFVWPRKTPTAGFSTWSNPDDTLFVLDFACWKEINSPENLGICEITEEEVYYKYIFRKFSLFTTEERYEHLVYIRDYLFPQVEMDFKNESPLNETNNFWQKLRNLHCIGTCTLRQVKEYCDDDVKILAIFSKDLHFLPNSFKASDSWKKWLEFFKKLGLKCTISTEEFLQYCEQTASGSLPDHVDVESASSALLEHLFSRASHDEGWHDDQKFLGEVANVPFVPVEPVPELTWIYDNRTVDKRNQVKLNEAATLDCSIYSWTFKPIIKLPEGWENHSLLLEQLEVMHKPQSSLVAKNLLNICTSESEKLAPNKNQPDQEMTLMQLIAKHFDFLQEHRPDKEFLENLRDLPCIPVNLTKDKVILVKPSCVLLCNKLNEFHPYLHQLDQQLTSSTSLLMELGVELTVGLSHLQLVLKQGYKDSQKEPKQETKYCVSAAVRKLYQLLSDPSHSSEDDASKQQAEKISDLLSPLYLPNHEGKLALSTTLLYADNDLFEGIQPQLEDTDYSLLRIEKVPGKGVLLERELCNILPEQIKPKALSGMCTLTVSDNCERIDHSRVGDELQVLVKKSEFLSEAVALCVQFFSKTQAKSEVIEATVHQFLSNIKICTYKSLTMTVTFIATGEVVGTKETNFYLNVADTEHLPSSVSGQVLLDVQLRNKTKVIRALTNHLLHLIKPGTEATQPLSEILFELLETQSFDEVIQVLGDSLVSTVISESWKSKFKVKPNPAEGRRWLKQAEANFKSLLCLHSSLSADNLEICGDVCFMAHQVAEKALKGGMYFVCGLSDSSLRSHYFSHYAKSLDSKHQTEAAGLDLASHAASLECHYLYARYPNMWDFPAVPAEKYSIAKAEAAKSHAEAILKIVKKLVVS